MVEIVVLQSIVWYTLMLFLFEYCGARALIAEQFPDVAGSITSFRVESDVVSLNGFWIHDSNPIGLYGSLSFPKISGRFISPTPISSSQILHPFPPYSVSFSTMYSDHD